MKVLAAVNLAVSLASAAALPAALPDADTTSLGGVRVGNVKYGGTGCNQGSLSIHVSDDGSICPIYTKDLVAVDGPGTEPADSRRFCQLNFDLSYPAGWSFSVLSAEYTGYVDLEKSSTGHVQSKYYFSGDTDEAVSRVDFTGPVTEVFKRRDAVVWDVWSPCGRTSTNLNVHQEVAVDGNGIISSTSTEGQLINAVALRWRRC